jgi:hypothetical protein
VRGVQGKTDIDGDDNGKYVMHGKKPAKGLPELRL